MRRAQKPSRASMAKDEEAVTTRLTPETETPGDDKQNPPIMISKDDFDKGMK